MPSGTSCEALAMHSALFCEEDDKECSLEWVIAAGNAAKAARRVVDSRYCALSAQEPQHSDMPPNAVENPDDASGYDEKQSETTTTTTSSMGVKRSSGSIAGVVVDDDDEDYDYDRYTSEEDGMNKKSRSAALSQSVHIIHQQYEQLKALIAAFRPFLVKTWNWLHYFLVTIIFLNVVDAVRGDSSQNQAVIDDDNTSVGSESSGEGETGSEQHAEREDNPTLDTTPADDMSPNTCSIQNQEVEKASLASGEKSENAESPAPATDAQPTTETKPQPADDTVSAEDALQTDDGFVDEDASSDTVDSLDRRDSLESVASSEGSSGNLGDIEDVSCDKSENDKSDEPTTCVIKNSEESDKLLAQKIIAQVETMFSDEHLTKDGFLLKHVRRRSDGFVSLKLVAGLRKVKQISRDFPVVLSALRDSAKLEINADGTKVRRLEPLTPALKSLPIKSKDKERTDVNEKESSSNDENQHPKNARNDRNGNNHSNRRYSAQHPSPTPNNGSQSRRNSYAYHNQQQNYRKSSTASTTSSNNSSRHNSFSRPAHPHPADLFRNVYTAAGLYSSSGEESQSPQVGRRRGGSLPITALQKACGLSPTSSPPNGSGAFLNGLRPKSNSYCEGAGPSTMSPWLQKRKASATSRLSNGDLVFNGVIRQPRGPDGTKGFATGYRAMILQERLQQQNSAVSA